MKIKSKTTVLTDDPVVAAVSPPVPAEPRNPRTFQGETLAEPEEDERASPRPARALQLPDRYADRGLLGLGGMGEVRRVYDRVLDRSVAMKLVRTDRMGSDRVRDHFGAETRATAKLAHPGIVQVSTTELIQMVAPGLRCRRSGA